MIRRTALILAVVAVLVAMMLTMALPAFAAQPDTPNCFGKVSSQLAGVEDEQPGIGEHSSDPVPGDEDRETPRQGVGNVAGSDGFFDGERDHVSDHGTFVASLDANPETACGSLT